MNLQKIPSSNHQITLLLVVGVEGSGHHLVRDCLQGFLTTDYVVDKGDHYPLLEQRWDHDSPRLPFSAVRNELKRIFCNYQSLGVRHIFEDTSIPFGPHRRGPLKRMDLVDLLELVEGILDVRILILSRDPVSSTYSNLRRGFSDNLDYECRMTENSHIFIKSQIETAADGRFRIARFEDLLAKPQENLRAIATWFGIDPQPISDGWRNIRQPHLITLIPAETRLRLDRYFSSRRRCQWESFYDSHSLVLMHSATSSIPTSQ